MELDEILENIQSDLNNIQEKVKDAEAVLISYETPLPQSGNNNNNNNNSSSSNNNDNNNNDNNTNNNNNNISARNVDEMSKLECLKEIEQLKSICNVHKNTLLNDENKKNIFLANDAECIQSVKKMEDAENAIVNIDKNVKLVCDKYDTLRSQAKDIIFDKKNTNQMILAMRILHQNGGAMMMDDFKEQLRTRIGVKKGEEKEEGEGEGEEKQINPVQLVYTLLANRLVQFDRSNGTEVFSLLI